MQNLARPAFKPYNLMYGETGDVLSSSDRYVFNPKRKGLHLEKEAVCMMFYIQTIGRCPAHWIRNCLLRLLFKLAGMLTNQRQSRLSVWWPQNWSYGSQLKVKVVKITASFVSSISAFIDPGRENAFSCGCAGMLA